MEGLRPPTPHPRHPGPAVWVRGPRPWNPWVTGHWGAQGDLTTMAPSDSRSLAEGSAGRRVRHTFQLRGQIYTSRPGAACAASARGRLRPRGPGCHSPLSALARRGRQVLGDSEDSEPGTPRPFWRRERAQTARQWPSTWLSGGGGRRASGTAPRSSTGQAGVCPPASFTTANGEGHPVPIDGGKDTHRGACAP